MLFVTFDVPKVSGKARRSSLAIGAHGLRGAGSGRPLAGCLGRGSCRRGNVRPGAIAW